jgi:acetyl-CoA C-acetyltransferase
MAPIYNYALLETAVRGRAGVDPSTHQRALAELWSRFSEVAAGNPYAQMQRTFSAEELLTQSASNRPVSAPYSKLLTANIQVDQATGLIICSAAAAQAAGVPQDRWVFVWASAHAHDEWFLSERFELASSPAISAAGTAALEHAGVTIDEVAYIDLYSCFPSAVQIAARELGLVTDDADRPLTLTGGLTFAGGPGNNYSSHAIATLVQRLRTDPDAVGLTTLGGYVPKHASGGYSGRPPRRPFLEIDACEQMTRPAPRQARAEYSGPATIEAYTVPYDREGQPEGAIVSALTPSGERALARLTDRAAVGELLERDPLGRVASFGAQVVLA